MASGVRVAILALVVALAISACGENGDPTATDAAGADVRPDGLQVVTSTTIIAALTVEVGGDLIEVQSILHPGVDPHTFEPGPDQAAGVAAADLVLMNGIGLDDFLTDFVKSANSDAPVIVVTEGIELLGYEDDEEGETEEEHQTEQASATDHSDEDDHDHGEDDPHVWQDPLRVRQMVDNIAAALAEHDSANTATYQANADAYSERLGELDTEIRAMFDPIPVADRKVVTNHDALAYFAERYHIEIVGTVIPGGGGDAEPSAQQLAELVELIESAGVRAILAEQLIDPKIAEQLANDAGVEIVYGIYTDSVGEPGSGAESVDGMLRANAALIRDALVR